MQGNVKAEPSSSRAVPIVALMAASLASAPCPKIPLLGKKMAFP